MFAESDLLPLYALQHICFCERQCALIHVEQVWLENRFTAEGRIMHERVDSGKRESRKDVRIAYSLSLQSLRLGLVGKADVVEFHKEKNAAGKMISILKASGPLYQNLPLSFPIFAKNDVLSLQYYHRLLTCRSKHGRIRCGNRQGRMQYYGFVLRSHFF